MDDVTWGALTLTLTLIGGLWTVYAFRRRGVASGLRGAGLTLLPAAAWMTGTLEMFTDIGGAVADWATHLVFSPVVWAGVVLAGISVLLLGASGTLRERGRGGKPAAGGADASHTQPQTKAQTKATAKDKKALAKAAGGEPMFDDDMADIEAILRKRGIT